MFNTILSYLGWVLGLDQPTYGEVLAIILEKEKESKDFPASDESFKMLI